MFSRVHLLTLGAMAAGVAIAGLALSLTGVTGVTGDPRPESAFARFREQSGPVTITVAESIGVVDSDTSAPPATPSIAETLGVADTALAAGPAEHFLTETLGVADAVKAAGPAETSLSEALGVVDAVTAAGPAKSSVTESLGVADTALIEKRAVNRLVAPDGSDTLDGFPNRCNVSACATIQHAIDMAVAGDAVLAGSGTYEENLRMKTGVDVLGAGAASTTIAGAPISQGTVHFDGVTEARLEGVTLTVSESQPGVDRAIVFFEGSGQTAEEVVIQNNVITGVQYGVFLWGDPTAPVIRNNTLHGIGGQGIYIGNEETSPVIHNNIIIGFNFAVHVTASEPSDLPFLALNLFWDNLETYRNFPAPDAGAGNSITDPLLVDTENGDFHLTEESPAIDAGMEIEAPGEADMDGEARVADGDGDGAALIDIGADEFIPEPAPEITLTVESQGEGAVDVSPDQPTYEEGAEISLTATPSEGWRLDRWSVLEGEVEEERTENPLTLTLTTNSTVSALFVETISEVSGLVQDSQGASLEGVQVSVEDTEGTPYLAHTDSNGAFHLTLEDGTYTVVEMSLGDVFVGLSIPFTIDGGALTDSQALTLVFPSTALSGLVTQGVEGSAAAFANLVFSPLGDEGEPDRSRSIWTDTSQNGQFQVVLPNDTAEAMTYILRSVWLGDRLYEFQPEDLPAITVEPGGAVAPGNLTVVLPQPNVVGLVEDSSGEPVADAWVEAMGGDGQVHGAATDASGRFRLSLEDGAYTITDIFPPDGHREVTVPFIVVGGQLAGPGELAVVLERVNVTGSVMIGGHPAPNAWVRLTSEGEVGGISIGGPDDDVGPVGGRWIVTDASGKFSLHLPAGEWTVMGVGTSQQWHEFRLSFTAPVEGLVVSPPEPNVTGVVQDSSGNPLSNASVGIRPEDASESEWQRFGWTTSEPDGSFSFNLDPGEYVIFEVWHRGLQTPFDMSFTVGADGELVGPGGASTLAVLLPQPNVLGTVQNRKGERMPNARVGLRPANSTDADWQAFQWIGADSLGGFKASLEPGEWMVRYLDTRDAFEELRLPFTVVAEEETALVVAPPQRNVHGVVEDANGAPMANTWVGVQPEDAAGEEARQRWTVTDAEGRFSLALQPGDYVVFGLDTPNGWVEIHRPFNAPAEDMTLSLPTPNVTGHLDGRGWIAVRPAGADDSWAETQWTQSRPDGAFKMALQPGDYIIVGIEAPEWVRLDLPITVPSDGELDLGIVGPPDANVTGTLTDAQGLPLPNGWIAVERQEGSPPRYFNSDGDGNVAFHLPAGGWAVTVVHDDTEFLVDIPFTVPEGGSVEINPSTPSAVVNGSVTLDGEPLPDAWLGIRPLDAEDEVDPDPDSTRMVRTNGDGDFTVSLPDGSYAVIFVNAGEWHTIESPEHFEIESGVTASPVLVALP